MKTNKEIIKNTIKILKQKADDRWKEAEEILKLCTKENEFTTTNDEIRVAITYEELCIPIPSEYVPSGQLLKGRIDDLRREAFNYLRMYVNDEGNEPLEKAIELTKRYNEAMGLWIKYIAK